MDAKYNHLHVEEGKNKKWIEKKFFINHDVRKKPFSIILPPPNVTGRLHLGHAWDSYLQDTIIRFKKLQGFDVCFVPGMDHAGIATQAKVEQKIIEMGLTKHELGREKFLEQTNMWKIEYANQIRSQWSKLGLALDYSSERFTLDKESNEAVNKVFVEMYKKGLIYKGIKAINWDPKLQTALSNIEVISKPTPSKMYYIKYYFENSKDYVIIATTRPETIFSDVAIALNPNDKRLKNIKALKVVNPLNGRILPIISDEYIDMNFGTGIMKVSAHAVNDIEIITKNNLEIIESINLDGRMNENALFTKGMTREDAREAVYRFLEKNGNIDFVQNIVNNVSYSDRSNEVIEILVMPQWFVKMNNLAQNLLNNLNSKDKVRIYPKRFEDVLRTWMDNVHDWTISRQLWWGHRIPAWYKDDEIKVQIESPGENWKQDEDVLDTWFSSALCPFSFFGWPNNIEKVKRYTPTSVLVTGYDIIFFWVARMYFQSLEFMGQIPFKDLLIHGLIRDEQGRKMSKSLGNGIDPMEVIDRYGSDSLRWYLLTNSTPGQDINFSIEKIESAWSLCNKLWNIARFIKNSNDDNLQETSLADKWINNKLVELKKIIDDKMCKYEFTIIGKEIKQFIYNDFSSWYIEFSKVWPNKKYQLKILKNLLIIIHPFLPFITDHIYLELFGEELLENNFDLNHISTNDDIIKIIEVVTLIRNARNDFNISNKQTINYFIQNNKNKEILLLIDKLANAKHKINSSILYSLNKTFINIEISKEQLEEAIKKMTKQLEKLEFEISRSKKILNNDNFIKKAPTNMIEIEKQKFENYKEQYENIKNKIRELK